MEFHRNSMPQDDRSTTVVTGTSLADAFKKVRLQFGPEAVISGSRSGIRSKKNGWGTEKVIEVLVDTPGTSGRPATTTTSPPEDLTRKYRREVERLERMVEDICRPVENDREESSEQSPANPLADYLVANGASPGAVDRLLARFAVATGKPQNDRPAALAWMTEYLGTGQETLETLGGNHVVLSDRPAEALDLLLDLAGRLITTGRRVLVVSLMPDPDREEPYLKTRASAGGFDAAVVRNADQLPDMEGHLGNYDVVLLTLPELSDPCLSEGGPVYRWLAGNENFQRHLMMPLDRDFQDLDDLQEAARHWNCDWLALSRVEGTRRAAKVLDLVDRIPLPISFMGQNTGGTGTVACATEDLLLDKILSSGTSVPFKPGLTSEAR